jgi:hypothetical protein
MITSRKLAALVIAASVMTGAPAFAPAASAQSSNAPPLVSMPTVSTAVPVILWAATGAVIGAVIWPAVAVGGAAAAAPGGVMSVGAFLNAGAAAGAFLGGAGYILTR